MKVVFNSHFPQSPATIFYRAGFSRSDKFFYNDFQNYSEYNVVLFMGFEQDLAEIAKAKKSNPDIKVGVVDPRGDHVARFIDEIDFFVVDSIEMEDYFAKYLRPIYRYYEYTDIETNLKEHTEKKNIIIGYHGNKVHLMSMFPKITLALDSLSEKYSIELWCIYNIKNVGVWDLGLPEKVKVKHIQFDEEKYGQIISQMDVGIVPANIPFNGEKSVIRSILPFRKVLNHDYSDYCLRFKMPTNAGRILIFAKLGVPVVADMFPSAFEIIKNGVTGYVAHSTGGWYHSLEKLIISAEERKRVAHNLFEEVNSLIDYDLQTQRFLKFLETFDHKKVEQKLNLLEVSKHYGTFEIWYYFIRFKFKQIAKRIFNFA